MRNGEAQDFGTPYSVGLHSVSQRRPASTAVEEGGIACDYGAAEQSLHIGDDLLLVVAGVKAWADAGVQQELHHYRGVDTMQIELVRRHAAG